MKNGNNLYFVIPNQNGNIKIECNDFKMFIESKERIYVLNQMLELFYFDMQSSSLKQMMEYQLVDL